MTGQLFQADARVTFLKLFFSWFQKPAGAKSFQKGEKSPLALFLLLALVAFLFLDRVKQGGE